MTSPPPDFAHIETPAAIVDVGQVRANAHRAVEYCELHGLSWRPHIKTHKSLEVARIQLDAGARGLTVATPREAEVMSRLTDDILLAYPPVGSNKLGRLLSLPESVRLEVALDSREVADGLSAAASRAGRTVGVLVEMDVGMRRVGVATPDRVVALAHHVREARGLSYEGILFYPGHIRGKPEEQDEELEALTRLLREVWEALAAVDLTPVVVSGGSTPTLWRSHELPHVTEVRAGTWIFNDRDSASIGVAEWSECAYSVLATVVSTAVPGQAVVDAGSKALSKESRGGGDGSFGVLRDRPEVPVRGLSEEHGILDLSASEWKPAIGERVRIIPNHVCVSVNLQDQLWAVREDRVERWSLPARGRSAPTPGESARWES